MNASAAAGMARRAGYRRTRRPVGQTTRGKTAANRLRRVDAFMLLYDAQLFRRRAGDDAQALFVDLGYGATPVTTLESALRFRKFNPHLPVLGVEIDPARVAAAAPFADELTHFRLGGFNLPLARQPGGHVEAVRAIRAFNVLRQYEETEVAPAYAELALHALPGALLVEGTSDPAGDLWVANVLRRAEGAAQWRREAVVFSTRLRSAFSPAAFQAVLPKNLIHRVQPGEPIQRFFEHWKDAARRTSHQRIWGDRRWFVATGRALFADGVQVDPRRRWLARGYLVVYSLGPDIGQGP